MDRLPTSSKKATDKRTNDAFIDYLQQVNQRFQLPARVQERIKALIKARRSA